MIRRWLFAVVVFGAALTVLPAADPPTPPDEEPPIRLKKKDRPADKPDQPADRPADRPGPRPGDKIKEDPPDVPDEPMIDEQELLQQILKNSQKAADRLTNQEVDDPTKQLQRDVIAGLDKLIQQAQQPPQDGQGGAQQQPSGGQQSKGQAGQQSGSRGSQQARGNRGSQTARGQGQGQPQQGEGQPNQGGQSGMATQGGKGGTSPPEEAVKLAEIYKDIWGHLPEALRAEMNAYSREQFMDKYRDQLKRYYSTLAEKGRKGD